MDRLIIQHHDIATDEIVIREMNDEEFDVYKKGQEEAIKVQNEIKEKESIRQSALAKLAALGLTEEEIAAL